MSAVRNLFRLLVQIRSKIPFPPPFRKISESILHNLINPLIIPNRGLVPEGRELRPAPDEKTVLLLPKIGNSFIIPATGYLFETTNQQKFLISGTKVSYANHKDKFSATEMSSEKVPTALKGINEFILNLPERECAGPRQFDFNGPLSQILPATTPPDLV